MCATARTSSLWRGRVLPLNPDSLMNILFPSDCSMDSALVRWRGYPRRRPPFFGVVGRRLIQEIAMRAVFERRSRDWAAQGIGSPAGGAAHAGLEKNGH